MPSPLRDVALLGLFGTLLSLTQCSQLTKVDWGLVKPEASGGAGGASAGQSGAAGENPGAGEGGMAGEAGAAAGEGGEIDEGGSSGVGGTFGGGGQGGSGGAAGSAGSAGSGGTLGGGDSGTGGAGPLHPTCTTAPPPPTTPPDLSQAIVFFDGGAGGNGNRGGRTGLDRACDLAKTALGLPQAETHAVISVSPNNGSILGDEIFNMPEIYHIPRISPHVVSPIGIELGSSWNELWKGTNAVPSLVCSGVMPPTVTTWLTGTNKDHVTNDDPMKGLFVGVYDSFEISTDPSHTKYNNGCNGWTSGAHEAVNMAQVGSAIADRDPDQDRFATYRRYACDAADDHILCAAYDPVP